MAKKTDEQKAIDRINALRQDGKISQKEAQSLRQTVRDNSTASGALGANDRKVISQATQTATATGGSGRGGSGTGGSGSGTGGSGTGTGGTGGTGTGGTGGSTDKRPPKPGDAWIWSPARNKWIRPPAPGDGQHAWDDNLGWVKRSPIEEEEEEEKEAVTLPCEEALGAAQEGFRWVGSYVTNADGTVSNTCRLEMIEEEEEPEDTSRRDADRRMAREEFIEILTNMGFTTAFGFTQTEIDDLTSNITSWIEDGWADGYDGGDKLLMKFRTSKETKNIYAKRFTGMSALAARGQAISEGDYISLESSIRNVLRSSNIDPKFYDSFDDYGRFIAGGVSPDEVRDRITAVQSLINPTIMAELEEYYGIGTGTAEAFLLGLTDEKGVALEAAAQARSQQEIRDIGRNIQIGGLAEASGFRMGMTEAQRLAGTVTGQGIDPFDPRTQSKWQGTFQQSRRIADRERTLAGIDREAYAEMDTLEAAFGDEQKRLASERRAKRERARFAGSAGTAAGSLGVERNF